MSVPSWISEALDVSFVVVDDATEAKAAIALLERLPIARMVDAAAIALVGRRAAVDAERAQQYAAAVITAITQVLADEADHDVVDIARLYQESSRALDIAGVPYACEDGAALTQPDRIAWLAHRRPTALDLHRAMDGVSTTIADLRTALDRERTGREQDRIAGVAAADEDLRTINTLRAELRDLRAKLEQANSDGEEMSGQICDLQDENDAHERRTL